MRLTRGSTLGPYEILDRLGAGGMGEVYRARDTRLGRTVAIKILLGESSHDPRRQTRFLREAKVIATLNHPHICTLYDLGRIENEDEPAHYLVMEYLEGETLDHRLKRGRLSFTELLSYAIQIASALDRAHQHRILHRDLKPSNIMITKFGAKLLDFGLAKYFRSRMSVDTTASGIGASDDVRALDGETTDEKPITASSLVGTLEYMSPEQLEGREPDSRSDIFSFAVCLYEMATGHRPFRGESRATLLAAMLAEEPPPVSGHEPLSPPAFDWLVRICLSRKPADRFQTMHDITLELVRIAEMDMVDPRSGPFTRKRSFRTLAWSLAAIIAIAGALAGWNMRRDTRAEREPAPRRFTVALPSGLPLTSPDVERFAVSPDGRHLVYASGIDSTQLHLYSFETAGTRSLPGTSGGRGPFFSPDGQWVGFHTIGGELKKVSIAGGPPMTLSRGRDIRGATWAPDRTIIFADLRSPLQRISDSGGPSEALPAADPRANVRWPALLPGGEHILCTVNDFSGDYEHASLAALSRTTGKFTTLVNGATYGRYVPTGHLVYFHSGSVFAVRFDPKTLAVTGPPIAIAENVESHSSTGLAHFATSADGALFYVPRRDTDADAALVSVDRAGNATAISNVRRPYGEPRLSPDGKRLIVTVDSGQQADLWMFTVEADSWRRLTDTGRNTTGIWSPDGSRVVFASNRGGEFNLFMMPVDSAAPPKQITDRKSWPFPTAWSRDGETIALVEQYRGRGADIFTIPAGRAGDPRPLLSQAFDENYAVFSPDGRWIAYQSNESGTFEIYAQPYPEGGAKWMVSSDGGTLPVWRRDGGELFYRSGNRVMAVDLRLQSEFRAGKPRMLFRGEFEPAYDVTADGDHFIMIRRGERTAARRINVVLDAFARRVSEPSEVK